MSGEDRTRYYIIPIPFLLLSIIAGAGSGWVARLFIPHPAAEVEDSRSYSRRLQPGDVPAVFEETFPNGGWAPGGKGILYYDEKANSLSGLEFHEADDGSTARIDVHLEAPDSAFFDSLSDYPNQTYETNLSADWRLRLVWTHKDLAPEVRAIAEHCTDPRIREELLAAIEAE